MNKQKLLACFAVAFLVFASACATRRSPDVERPPTPELPKITIGNCLDFYGLMGVGTNDMWRTYESNGLPDNCRYIHSSFRVELNFLSSSDNLQSSKCWNGRSFVFEGGSITILYYYPENSPELVLAYTDFKDVADFSGQNFTENGRDQALLNICPPNIGQIKRPWPGNWHLLNFAADQGSDYETILYNIFGAGGGGSAGLKTGFGGMDATKGAQSVENFEFRNTTLDTNIIPLAEEHSRFFNELIIYPKPVIDALYGQEGILRAAKEAAIARGDKKNAERLGKEMEKIGKETVRYMVPIWQMEDAVNNRQFSGISVESPIKSLADTLPVRIDSLLDLGILTIEIGEETIDIEELKKNKVEFIPRTEREPFLVIAKKRSDIAFKVQELIDKGKRELEKRYQPEIFAEPNLRPGKPILISISFTGPKYTRFGDKTQLKIRLRQEFYPADERDIVDMEALPITDKEAVIFKIDDLLAKGITAYNLPDGGTLDLRLRKEEGYVWSPPIFFRKQGSEATIPSEEGKYLTSYEFLSDEAGYEQRLTAAQFVFFTERTQYGDIPCVLAPGIYKIHLTLIDTLRDADDKKRELELPTITFRIMYPQTEE
ncbi:MAG: hypothetical protein Q8P49_04180 [Candidatus Liptonbacteria bacterium]|nr:hypothetical protein [Candidatus Liptonbacteria bacterium]